MAKQSQQEKQLFKQLPPSHSFPVKMIEKKNQQAPIAQSEPSDTDLDSTMSSPSLETGTTKMGSDETKTPVRRESSEAPIPYERRSFVNLLVQKSKHSVNSDAMTNTLRGK